MVKTKKVKKSKVKKIANVLQRVTVNVLPARSKSKNAKAHANNGFNQFQAKNRILTELSAMPSRIKEIIGDRRENTTALMEERLKQITSTQELMNRQISNRVEKQSINKYLENIAFNIKVTPGQLKSGAQDIDTGVPIK